MPRSNFLHSAVAILAAVALAPLVQAQQRPLPAQSPAPSRTFDAAALADPEREYVPGEILVKFRGAPPANALAAVRGQRLKRFARSNIEHWRLGQGVDVEQAMRILRGPAFAGAIEYVEPNYILRIDNFPDDPLRGDLWGMHNVAQTGGTKDADIDAPEAWQTINDASTVIVGVIDTGIDYNHPDLAANIWSNPGEIPGNGIDDDGNGYIDDVRGWDFINNDNDPMDDHSHGTHTAGTIGAVGNNSIGVAGVAWRVQLMPLKIFSAGGTGPASAGIAAVEYAADMGARITNNSWGGGPKSRALEDAIAASNSLFVASAGNSGSSRVQYPAGYSAANIISVAATDQQDRLAGFSNYGSNWVDLGAPGVDTLSTAPGERYALKSGTSMAAPHVAGAAALVLAKNPSLTPIQLKNQILSTVDPLGALKGITVSGGRLNVRRAVQAGELPNDPTAPAPVSSLVANQNTLTFESIELSWPASGDDGAAGTAYSYDLRYSTSLITEANWANATRAVGEPLPAIAGSTESFILTGLKANTRYYAAVKVMDEAGNISMLSNVPDATTLPPPPDAWIVYDIENGPYSYYNSSLAYDFTGLPTVAYSGGNDAVKFARWNGSSWITEQAGTSHNGISMAYDLQGNPNISHGWGKLYFTSKNGSSWSSQVLEKNASNDVTSLAYCGGSPAVSYRLNGLKVARKLGTSWTTTVVEAGAGAKFSALAFDDSCNPAVAYSDDINKDGWLDTLKFAYWDGTSWKTEIVDTGPVGYGVYIGLAFDISTNRFSVAHRGTGQVRFFRREAANTWVREEVHDGTQYVSGMSLTFDQGNGYLAFGASYDGNSHDMIVAKRDSLGNWSVETVDSGITSPGNISIKVAPDGQPSVTYPGVNSARFAKKGGLE